MGDEVMTTLTELQVHRPPEVVLEEARKAALALKSVISQKPKPVIFNQEQYIEFEDWQLIAHFYGVTTRVMSTGFVQFGDVVGWEASADAVHVASGRILSSAESMCLNDEEKWRTKPKYEWHYVKKSGGLSADDPGKDELIWEEGADGRSRPKKERVRVGDEAVPLFQLRSMAQTRAQAKVLSNVFRYVVVLAGFKATPAEEMTEQAETPRTNAGATPTNGTAPQPRADDSALVIGIETKSGKRQDGTAWTAYVIKLDDGRAGTTFDEGLAKAAQAAKDAGVFVIPTLEKKETKRGPVVNLTRLVDVEVPGDGPGATTSISADQVDRLLATARGMGWTDDDLEKFYAKHTVAFPQEFTAGDYSTLLNELKQGPKGA